MSPAQSHSLEQLSTALGWMYFTAWSVSFYPQVVLNFQRKSVVGMSFDYVLYNITGFLCYTAFSIATLTYQHNHHLVRSVQPNDVAFAVHAVVLTLIIIYQIFAYERGGQRVHPINLAVVALLWCILGYNVLLSSLHVLPWITNGSFSFVHYLGDVKVIISLLKYIPQAYLNFQRKSTVGWSIGNILLDLTGGLLSFTQQVLDAYNHNDWGVFSSNLPKLLLSLESVGFDLLFIVQHYCLYTDRTDRFASRERAGSKGANMLGAASDDPNDDILVVRSEDDPNDPFPVAEHERARFL